MSQIGFRILEREPSPVDPTLLDDFATLGSSQVSDCMGRLYGAIGLHPFHHGSRRLAGIALTVKTRPGDNLMIHKALLMAGPEDVIVVDGGGDLHNALIGELMMAQAHRRNIRGFVIDGAVRDVDSFTEASVACFARGVSHRGPYKEGPGEINVAVSIAGQVVQPGDVVLGDADGVVCIPAALAREVLELAQEKKRAEAQSLQRILSENPGDKPWVDRAIAEKSGGAS